MFITFLKYGFDQNKFSLHCGIDISVMESLKKSYQYPYECSYRQAKPFV